MFLNTAVSTPLPPLLGEWRDTLKLPAAFRCTVIARDIVPLHAPMGGTGEIPIRSLRDSRELRIQTPAGRVNRAELDPPASSLYSQPTTKLTLLGESAGVRSPN
jgi:hypothetical protein